MGEAYVEIDGEVAGAETIVRARKDARIVASVDRLPAVDAAP